MRPEDFHGDDPWAHGLEGVVAEVGAEGPVQIRRLGDARRLRLEAILRSFFSTRVWRDMSILSAVLHFLRRLSVHLKHL